MDIFFVIILVLMQLILIAIYRKLKVMIAIYQKLKVMTDIFNNAKSDWHEKKESDNCDVN